MKLPAFIPAPQRLVAGTGACSHRGRVLRVDPASAADEPVRRHAAAAGLKLTADAALPACSGVLGTADLPEAPARAQAYGLRVASDGIALRGHDPQGLRHALATLRQAIGTGAPAPCLEISDWPTFGIRYHHDDISRKQVSTMADFRRIIRHLAAFKVSHYTPYIEDMLLIDGLPQLGESRGALTPAEIRELVAEGTAWGVEVFPTISLSGHQENLLRLPAYRHLGAKTWQPPSTFEPGLEAVRTHLLKVIDAACPLFTSPWFHMGFDEVIGLDADGFVSHLNWCAERLVERGKKPLFWADMLYNHFGCDLLKRLHPAATPIAWGYSKTPDRAQSAIGELLQHREQAWMLAGYNNWGSFLHDTFENTQTQWSNWAKVADPARVSAHGASQWGDDGYENSRDLGWPLFAACAERGWSGPAGDPASVETRFHLAFHGAALPELGRLRRLLGEELAIPPGRAWRLHRLPAPGWVRLAKAGRLPTAIRLAADQKRLVEARRLLRATRTAARHERGHLDHLAVAIDRIASVVTRAQAAHDVRRVPAAITALAKARRSYRAAWLAHNRPENIEVSLAIFDTQAVSWRELRRRPAAIARGWHALDLGKTLNTCGHDIAGMPIGPAHIAGVPFRFAPVQRTHAEIAPAASVSLALPGVPIRDLHMVITQPRDGETPRPGARLRLLRKGRLLYEEELQTIRHLCDWWAPLGEHMWAGGGLAYADPMRVRYLVSPCPPYGLTCISRFPWPAAPAADRLELTNLGTRPLQLFAITVEEALR